jgi:hypothetical protein
MPGSYADGVSVPGRDEARRVASWGRQLGERVRRTRILVALLGAGARGLDERRAIARSLRRDGVLVLIPEDDFPLEVSPSLAEGAMFPADELDLIFLNVGSWGSATELGQFHRDPEVSRKLRLLVSPDHHPLFGRSRGYLADVYLTHLAAFGHVYPVDGGRSVPVPEAADLVRVLTARHRQIKALNPELIK